MVTPVKLKVYPLSYDLMFKHIFGTNKNIRFTKYLLEKWLGYSKEELIGLKVLNSAKLNKEKILDKNFEADVIVQLITGDIINLEMYNHPSEISSIKSEMYACRLFAKQLKKGKDYTEAKTVSQYNFIKNGCIKRDDIIAKFTLRDKNNKSHSLKDYIKIYDINIDYEESGKEEVQNIIRFMNAKDEKEMYKEMCVYSEEDFLTPCYDREEYLKNVGRELGEEEGRKAGIKEGILKIVRNMLSNNMTPDEIAKVTNISIEEVNSIKENKK